VTRCIRITTLLALVMTTVLLGPAAGAARQADILPALPGVTIETLARGPAQAAGKDLALLRVTLTPDGYISPGAEPAVALLSVETGGARLWLLLGDATVTRQGVDTPEGVNAGNLVTLQPGDAAAFDAGTRLSINNPTQAEATLLMAVITPQGQPLLVAHPARSFSVETYACPPGVNVTNFDFAACSASDTSLVQWSLSSDRFEAPLDPQDATVKDATTTWEGLPAGTYQVDLTAEAFAPGYVDYYIPSSNQVTREGPLTTRIFYNADRSRGSIGAFVFAGDGT
jgi:hypothetical protein